MFWCLSRTVSPQIGQDRRNLILDIGGMYTFRATLKRDFLGFIVVCSIVDIAPLVSTIVIVLEWIVTTLRSGGNIPHMKRSMKVVQMRKPAAKFSTTPNQIRTLRSPIRMCNISIPSSRTGWFLADLSPIFDVGRIFDRYSGSRMRVTRILLFQTSLKRC